MAYYLDYVTAGGKYLQMTSGSADIAAGQNFVLEFALKRTNASNTRFLGKNGASGGFRFPTATTFGVINTANGGPSFTVPANYVDFLIYNVSRNDGANVSLSVDGDTPQTGAQSGAFSLNRLFADIAGVSASGQVKYIKLWKDGVLTNHWENTTGTGTQMTDLVGGQTFNQMGTWPAGDSEWVFYESGGGTQHQSSSASALQLFAAAATTSAINSQHQNTSASASQVFAAAATTNAINGQHQQTSGDASQAFAAAASASALNGQQRETTGSASQSFSAAATALPLNSQQHQTTGSAAQAFTEATQATASNSQHRKSTGQVVSVAGFIASTSWVNAVNIGNLQHWQSSGSVAQAFSAQATATKTNNQHRQSGGQVSAATTFAATSSHVNTVLQIAAYTVQIKTRSISRKNYQTATRHSYQIKSRSNHTIELTTQSGGGYMQELNFKQGASALLVIDHTIDNEQVPGINAAKYELYSRTGQVLITKEFGCGIAFSQGKIEVSLTEADTAELSGNYNHQCVAKDTANRTFYPLNGDITFSATKPRL